MNERMLQTLEEIDSKLDEIDLLINQLPISNAVKREVSSKIYDVWSEIEEAVELRAADFD
jgi:hypothetical protein